MHVGKFSRLGPVDAPIVSDSVRVDALFDPTPADSRRELVLVLDAVEQLIAASHLHYRRIQAAAIHFGTLPEESHSDDIGSEKRATQVAIVADIGAFIGTLHRLRLLARRIPGDKETRLAKRAFEAEVRQSAEARHQLEHLDTAVDEISHTGEGAFGAVSWWESLGGGKGRWVAFFPGTMAEGAEAVTRKPAVLRERIDNIWCSIAGRHLNVSAMYIAVTHLEARLKKWNESQAAMGWPALKESVKT